jgi:hypothetical protein
MSARGWDQPSQGTLSHRATESPTEDVEPAKREGCRNTNRSVAWGATYRYARDPLQAYCMQHWELYHTHAVEEQQQYMFMLGRERKVIGKVIQALDIIVTQTEIEACSTYKAPRRAACVVLPGLRVT